MIDMIFSQITNETLTLSTAVLTVLSAAVLGMIISLTYMYIHKKTGYLSGFVLTLVIVPTTVALIIMLIGSNVARAFSLAGALSLIRYRSEQGNPKDIAYIFFSLAIGLACGIGFVGYAFLFTVIICLIMIILDKCHFGEQKNNAMKLAIYVPENLNYKGAFDDILKEYTTDFTLQKVKTTEFGSMFILVYQIHVSEETDTKEFLDKIRTRNGNLNIILSLVETETERSVAV